MSRRNSGSGPNNESKTPDSKAQDLEQQRRDAIDSLRSSYLLHQANSSSSAMAAHPTSPAPEPEEKKEDKEDKEETMIGQGNWAEDSKEYKEYKEPEVKSPDNLSSSPLSPAVNANQKKSNKDIEK